MRIVICKENFPSSRLKMKKIKLSDYIFSRAKSLAGIFRAMKNRNYRIFFIGQLISLTGTWMQQIALSWLVYRLTNSPFLLGMVGFVGLIPCFFITPVAGVIADRYDHRKMLVITQTLSMVQAVILSVLVLTNRINYVHVMILSAFLGIVNAFDMTIRQAFTIEMIDRKEDLSNAIALNSSLFNIARLVGPSIAGVLIAAAGEGICFVLNSVSYFAIIISLLVIKTKRRHVAQNGNSVFLDIKEGFRYAFGFIPIRSILLLLALVSLVGVPYQVLMPVFAKDVLHGGAHTLGFLSSMAGLGALAGAIYLAMRISVIGLGRMIAWAAAIFGVGMIFFSFSRVLWLSMLMIFISGFGAMVQMASSNTVLQTIADDDKRGRVMSFYTLSFIGTVPFGSLLAGSLASKIGAPSTLFISGVCCIAGAVLFFKKLPRFREQIRPVYVRKGIIPEVAKGIQSTT